MGIESGIAKSEVSRIGAGLDETVGVPNPPALSPTRNRASQASKSGGSEHLVRRFSIGPRAQGHSPLLAQEVRGGLSLAMEWFVRAVEVDDGRWLCRHGMRVFDCHPSLDEALKHLRNIARRMCADTSIVVHHCDGRVEMAADP